MATPRGNQAPRIDLMGRLGNPETSFKNPMQLTFIRQFVDIVNTISQSFVSTESATDEILLRSPGGKVFRVTVADNGTLTATYIQG